MPTLPTTPIGVNPGQIQPGIFRRYLDECERRDRAAKLAAVRIDPRIVAILKPDWGPADPELKRLYRETLAKLRSGELPPVVPYFGVCGPCLNPNLRPAPRRRPDSGKHVNRGEVRRLLRRLREENAGLRATVAQQRAELVELADAVAVIEAEGKAVTA